MYVIITVHPETNRDWQTPLGVSKFHLDVEGPFKSKVQAQKYWDILTAKYSGMRGWKIYIEQVGAPDKTSLSKTSKR